MSEYNPWRRLSRKPIYDNAWLELVEDKVLTPGGNESLYGLIQFKNNAVGILPVDNEDNIYLVGQYRYAIDCYSWEIPCGGHPGNEDTIVGAKRELKEETGLTADKWAVLADLHTSNSVTNEYGVIYLAQELTLGEPEFDETEDITIKKVSKQQALTMAMAGEITDAISLVAIMKYVLMSQ